MAFALFLMLGLLVLAGHHESRGQVRDPHGRVGGVHRLPARARGPEDVDAQIVRVDLEVDLFGLGQDGHRGRRGVDAPLALGLGDPLDAVHAGLVPEPTVGALSLDREDRPP